MASLKSIKQRRDSRIDIAGTPPAIFLNAGDIAVDTNSGGWVIDFEEETKTRKFTPMGRIIINNTSGSGLNIYKNQRKNNQKVCRVNTELVLELKGIRSVRISKRDATKTIVAGEVEVNVERTPLTSDEHYRRENAQGYASRLIKKFLGV